MTSHRVSSADDVIEEANMQASLAQHSADSDVASFRSFEPSPPREHSEENNYMISANVTNDESGSDNININLADSNAETEKTDNISDSNVAIKLLNMDDDDNHIDLTGGNSYVDNNQDDSEHGAVNESRNYNYNNSNINNIGTISDLYTEHSNNSLGSGATNSLGKFKEVHTSMPSKMHSTNSQETVNATEVKPVIVPASPRLFSPPIADFTSPKNVIHTNSPARSNGSMHNNSFGSAGNYKNSTNNTTINPSGISLNSSFVDTIRANVLRNALSPINIYNTTGVNTTTTTATMNVNNINNNNSNNKNNSSTSSNMNSIRNYNGTQSCSSNASFSRNTTPPFVRRDGLAGATTPILVDTCNPINNMGNNSSNTTTTTTTNNNNGNDNFAIINSNNNSNSGSISIATNTSNPAHERALHHLKRACEQIKRHQEYERYYETQIGHDEEKRDEDEAIEVGEHSNVTVSPTHSMLREANNVFHEHIPKDNQVIFSLQGNNNESHANIENESESKVKSLNNAQETNEKMTDDKALVQNVTNNNDNNNTIEDMNTLNESSLDVVISNPDINEVSSLVLLNDEEERHFVNTLRSVVSAADRIDEDDDNQDEEKEEEEDRLECEGKGIDNANNRVKLQKYKSNKLNELVNNAKDRSGVNIYSNKHQKEKGLEPLLQDHREGSNLSNTSKEKLLRKNDNNIHTTLAAAAAQTRTQTPTRITSRKVNKMYNRRENTPSRKKYAEWRDDDDDIMAPSTFFETNGTLCTNSNVVLKWTDLLNRPPQGDDELTWLYRHTFPLSLLDYDDLQHIINLSLRREYTKDDVIVYSNSILHHLYVVIWGNVEVFHEMSLDNDKKAMDEAFRVSSHAMCSPRHSTGSGGSGLKHFCSTQCNAILKEAPYLLSSMNGDNRRQGISVESHAAVNNSNSNTNNNNNNNYYSNGYSDSNTLTMHTATLQPGQVFGVEGYVFGEVSKYIFKAGGRRSKTVVALIPYYAIENALMHNVRFAQAIGASIVGCVDVFGPVRQFCRYVFSPAMAQNEYLPLWSIVDKYTKLGNVIHTKMLSKEVDTGAWGYALNRLPENITSTFCFDLVRALPPFVASRMRVEAHVADVRKQWASSSSSSTTTTTTTTTNNNNNNNVSPALIKNTTNNSNTTNSKSRALTAVTKSNERQKQLLSSSESSDTIADTTQLHDNSNNKINLNQAMNANGSTITFDSQPNNDANIMNTSIKKQEEQELNSTPSHFINGTIHNNNNNNNNKNINNNNNNSGGVLVMHPEINRARTDIMYIRTKERRRCTWHLGMEGKALVLLRDGFTDLLDFLTMLCVHIIESNKLRGRIQGMVHPPAIDILDAYLRTRDQENRRRVKLSNEAELKRIDTILSRMPLTDEERKGLMRIWGANTLLRIYEVMMHREEFNIRVDPSISRTFQTNLFHEWALNLRQCVLEKIGLDRSSPLPEDLCVDVVSSNTHCIKNLLSSFIRKYKNEILEYALALNNGSNNNNNNNNSSVLGNIDEWYNVDDAIYVSLPGFLQNARPDLKEEYSKSLEESGITVLHDTAMTGLQVDVIPVHQLDLNTIDDVVKHSLQEKVELLRLNFINDSINNNNNNKNNDNDDGESEMTTITNIHELSNDTLYGVMNEIQGHTLTQPFNTYKFSISSFVNNNNNNSSTNNNNNNNNNNASSRSNSNNASESFPTWDELAQPVWSKRKQSKISDRFNNKSSSMSSSLVQVSADTTKVNSPMSVIPSQNISRSVSQPHLMSIHSLNSSEVQHKNTKANSNDNSPSSNSHINTTNNNNNNNNNINNNGNTNNNTNSDASEFVNTAQRTLSTEEHISDKAVTNEAKLSEKPEQKLKEQGNSSHVRRLPRHFIINMDFAFGAQAAGICRAVFSVFGKTIRSVSVMGKAGGLRGKRGDIQLASHVLLSKSSLILEDNQDELRPCRNQDLSESRLRELAGPDIAVHYGKVLTLTGTMLQNVTLLRYYRSVWHCVGTEMEGSYFARVIEDFYRQGIANSSLITRFAYYSSDLPLAKEDAEQAMQQGRLPITSAATLSAPMTPREGVPPLYAIARGIIENVLLGY